MTIGVIESCNDFGTDQLAVKLKWISNKTLRTGTRLSVVHATVVVRNTLAIETD